MGPGQRSRLNDLATGWTVRRSNPGKGEKFVSFHNVQTQPSSQCLLRFFPGANRPGDEANHSPVVQCRGQELVEVYLYSTYAS